MIAQVQDLRGDSVHRQAVEAVASRAGLAGPRFGGVADVAGQTPGSGAARLRMGACYCCGLTKTALLASSYDDRQEGSNAGDGPGLEQGDTNESEVGQERLSEQVGNDP